MQQQAILLLSFIGKWYIHSLQIKDECSHRLLDNCGEQFVFLIATLPWKTENQAEVHLYNQLFEIQQKDYSEENRNSTFTWTSQ